MKSHSQSKFPHERHIVKSYRFSVGPSCVLTVWVYELAYNWGNWKKYEVAKTHQRLAFPCYTYEICQLINLGYTRQLPNEVRLNFLPQDSSDVINHLTRLHPSLSVIIFTALSSPRRVHLPDRWICFFVCLKEATDSSTSACCLRADTTVVVQRIVQIEEISICLFEATEQITAFNTTYILRCCTKFKLFIYFDHESKKITIKLFIYVFYTVLNKVLGNFRYTQILIGERVWMSRWVRFVSEWVSEWVGEWVSKWLIPVDLTYNHSDLVSFVVLSSLT